MDKFRVIIAGSRNFNNYDLLKSSVDFYLSKKIKTHKVIILSGTAYGADQLGERYAREHNIELERHPAHWDIYGKSAGYRRNAEMASVADALIAFWDGKSKGTGHMIDIAVNCNLQIAVINY